MIVYNLEYRILDKLGRTKSSHHVGLFKTEEDVNHAKSVIEKQQNENKISFDVYIIDEPFLKLS